MTAIPLIIDCDPGQDDAVNLLLAFASPEHVEILGITTVAGNAPVTLTQRNARLVCELAGRADVPVYAGCARPIMVEPITAEHVHGQSGIDGLAIRAPVMPLQPGHAVDFIVTTLMQAPARSVTFVATGPVTNLATALTTAPGIAGAIARIVMMGGAMREGGNITPSAEFNVRADPHAAAIVFGSGIPVVAFGLDVTHQLLVTPPRLARIAAIGNPVAAATYAMLSFSRGYDCAKYGFDGAPLHDPCTLAYILNPGLFQTKSVAIAVETEAALSLGHTAVDFWSVTSAPRTVEWAYAVDAPGFFDLLIERLSRYPLPARRLAPAALVAATPEIQP